MLLNAVRRYIRDARARPALAAGEQLDHLEELADNSFDGAHRALTSPMAPLTWMSRVRLLPTEQESDADPIKMGEPLEIVGLIPTVLFVDEDPLLIPPPIAAIDVFLEINRRDFITAQAEKRTVPGRDKNVVNLSMISAAISNRLLGLHLGSADPIFSVKYRWAVPVATVAALGWGEVQISLGFFVRPKIPTRKASVGWYGDGD